MKNIKISIVIPIYNSSLYLRKCLDSVINQEYHNIEIILINDGSTDNSLEICTSYKMDKRVKIIDKKNSGVSDTRNLGIQIATGDYILFVDSDDWLDEDCVSKCVKVLSEKKYDLLFFPYVREFSSESRLRKIFNEDKVFDTKSEVQNEILRRLIGPKHNEIKNPVNMEVNNAVWGKLYKSDVIRNIKFVDFNEVMSEDLLFNLSAIINVNNAIYIDDVVYHYNKENMMSLTKNWSENYLTKWKNLYNKIEKYINENDFLIEKECLLECLNRRKIINLITVTQQVFNTKDKYLIKLKKLKLVLSDSMYEKKYYILDPKELDIKWKLFFFCCEHKLVILLSILLTLIRILKKRG